MATHRIHTVRYKSNDARVPRHSFDLSIFSVVFNGNLLIPKITDLAKAY